MKTQNNIGSSPDTKIELSEYLPNFNDKEAMKEKYKEDYFKFFGFPLFVALELSNLEQDLKLFIMDGIDLYANNLDDAINEAEKFICTRSKLEIEIRAYYKFKHSFKSNTGKYIHIYQLDI